MSYTRGPGPLQGEHDKLKAAVGIVEDGDTATHAIAKGQYVIWKDDLYTAKSDISIGTTLSSSNLQAKTKGIGEDVASQDSRIKSLETPVSITKENFFTTINDGFSVSEFYCIKMGKIINLSVTFSGNNIQYGAIPFVINSAYIPALQVVRDELCVNGKFAITYDGKLWIYPTTNGQTMVITFTYICK